MQYKLLDSKNNLIEEINLAPLDGKVGEEVTKSDGSKVYLISLGEMTFGRGGVIQDIVVGTKAEADAAAK